MSCKELRKRLSNLSDMLSKVPLVEDIRHDVEKCRQTDKVINKVLAEVDSLLDGIEE